METFTSQSFNGSRFLHGADRGFELFGLFLFLLDFTIILKEFFAHAFVFLDYG